MQTNTVSRHRQALDVATSFIRDLRPDQMGRPSPCAGWDLRALLEHMVGQNHGFAAAVEGDDVPVSGFAARAFSEAAWEASAERVATAFADAPGERQVLLVEISPEVRFPATTAVGFHLLDTVVHTWDVATSVGLAFRPDDETVDLVHALALRVPTGPGREVAGAAFAPAVAAGDDDPWTTTLALLGRGAAADRSPTSI